MRVVKSMASGSDMPLTFQGLSKTRHVVYLACVPSTSHCLQLIHVYAKNYEGNGQLLLIRIVRYSLDGMVYIM